MHKISDLIRPQIIELALIIIEPSLKQSDKDNAVELISSAVVSYPKDTAACVHFPYVGLHVEIFEDFDFLVYFTNPETRQEISAISIVRAYNFLRTLAVTLPHDCFSVEKKAGDITPNVLQFFGFEFTSWIDADRRSYTKKGAQFTYCFSEPDSLSITQNTTTADQNSEIKKTVNSLLQLMSTYYALEL